MILIMVPSVIRAHMKLNARYLKMNSSTFLPASHLPALNSDIEGKINISLAWRRLISWLYKAIKHEINYSYCPCRHAHNLEHRSTSESRGAWELWMWHQRLWIGVTILRVRVPPGIKSRYAVIALLKSVASECNIHTAMSKFWTPCL